MEEQKKIRIVILIGSVRPGNYTSKAAAVVADEFGKDPRVEVAVVHPEDYHLALPGMPDAGSRAAELRSLVAEAAAVVIATPEYHGSFSAAIKMVIENLGFPSALAGKPVALLGVAAGSIGAIKSIEALRGVVSHVGALPLPMPVSLAHVHKLFAEDGSVTDAGAEKLLRALARSVLDYLRRAVCPTMTLERLLREGGTAAA
ncbi:MAG: NAD(P)H-dependent oxidoreductase [Bryobacteraceae bacterium]|nr:NAD(P)H-dependent oxidoreductase [Bryobacteraceae bacterium]